LGGVERGPEGVLSARKKEARWERRHSRGGKMIFYR